MPGHTPANAELMKKDPELMVKGIKIHNCEWCLRALAAAAAAAAAATVGRADASGCMLLNLMAEPLLIYLSAPARRLFMGSGGTTRLPQPVEGIR